ncbi:MFS transporter [Trinickia caryophylli]|uniref:Sugar phosphate permease n=1 Tax=Trinickia caryophylli TaxID=28094 RepID=A0A1X7D3D0_TRICW|nr:MFS transporter [Trinickia caryophylli]PMS12847.1 MFS transporter [Trinickia caryophylli]TRX15211.1 MFS transporter [Trinickia caryophylli]WQE15082.1 MFS transporter [Trinickia caryophylli]SMF07519.1 Sugar phosphate permease [Trinickia caryophylli]
MSDTSSIAAAPPRIRHSQRIALALLVVSGVVNYLDRGTLAVANSAIRADLGLSLAQMGVLLSAFSWSYALCQLPVGALVDRVGPRRLLGIGLVLWSVAQAAGGMVSTFGWFVLARILLGIGEAPQFPSAARVVSNWFPLRARGTPTGIFNSASPLGTALAPLLLSVLVVSFHWRWAFVVTGAIGLLVAGVWFALYRDPVRAQLSLEERRYLDAGAEERVAQPKVTFAEWRNLFSHATTWGMLIGFFGSVYLNWVYLTWLPGYLTAERHMSLMRTGVAASVPFFCGFLGALSAGWFSDLVTHNSRMPVVSRRNAVVIAMLGMVVFTIPGALAESNAVALACISVVIFLANAASASSWALATAAAPPSRVASLGAIQNFGGFIGGALAPVVTGVIAQRWSFVPALLSAAAIAFVGAMAYLLLVRHPIPEREVDAAPGPLPASIR